MSGRDPLLRLFSDHRTGTGNVFRINSKRKNNTQALVELGPLYRRKVSADVTYRTLRYNKQVVKPHTRFRINKAWRGDSFFRIILMHEVRRLYAPESIADPRYDKRRSLVEPEFYSLLNK